LEWDNHSIYDSSLVLALNFNNNSEIGETSSKAVDISRYGNNGTINGAVWTSSGRFGSALQFDGVDDYVDCGNGASLNITTAVTVEAWVNPLYSGWTRKKSITISGSTSILTDYQINIIIDYDSDMRSDYGDLRFV